MINEYELYHHGVKGMRWGVRRKAIKLTKMSRNADRYETKSKAWENRANALEKKSKIDGPMAYGRNYNKIKQMRTNAKQLKRYSEFGRKRTAAYMNKLSKDYKIVYDVISDSYTRRQK